MKRWLVPLAAFVLVTMGCQASDLFNQPTPTVLPTRTLAPTFTATPEDIQGLVIVTPPANGTPGVVIIPEGANPADFIVPVPTVTPTPEPNAAAESPLAPGEPQSGEPQSGEAQPQEPQPGGATQPPATPTKSPTPTPTETPTVTLTPTPFIVLDEGYTALRQGPGVEFPMIAQLGPNIPITVVGRNPEGDWLQLCCVNGEAVWVSTTAVRVMNDPVGVALVEAGPPPTPTWTPTATWTPTITPTPTSTPFPFEKAIGPQYFPTNNQFLTIWTKLFIGDPPLEVPAEGYYMKVLFEGFERPPTNPLIASRGEFEYSAPPGAGNRVQYNTKFEYTPPDPKSLDPNSTATRADLIGTGTWTVYVVDGAGNQLSDAVTFTTSPSNPNREIYLGFKRVR